MFSQLEYGFDDYLYCSCGAGHIHDYQFRCNGHELGVMLESFPKHVIRSLVNNLKSFNGVTILILGETGVGKSTFINGFANYLQFKTLVKTGFFIFWLWVAAIAFPG